MEERNKKFKLILNVVVRPIVLIAVFIGAFFGGAAIMNRNNQGVTAEMADCTFPTITAQYQGIQVNRMYGYARQMDAGTIRPGLTLLDEHNKLPIQIQTFGTEVKAIHYEVRSRDMERLVEKMDIEEFQEIEGRIDLYLEIKDLLEEKEEYCLLIQLDIRGNQSVYYYARIRKDNGSYARKYLDFSTEFHNKTFSKDNEEGIVRYLESNNEGDNSSFHSVNIHSSYDLVTWGSLEILDKKDLDISLKEINEQTGIVTLDYTVVLKNSSDESQYYHVNEYYRLRYTDDRMYLLDFERSMNQYFNIDHKVIYSTAVQLGITGSDIEHKGTADGKKVCFSQEGELFSYNSSEHSMAKVFGFWKDEGDVRYRNLEHDIKIINVDEKGNTDFVVYGYMNRGIHEGKVGVSVCHYDCLTNATQEYAFLESDSAYEVLKQEVGELVYLNGSGQFYIHLKNDIYQIDMNTRKVKVLAEDITMSEFAVSADNTLLVIQKEKELVSSNQLLFLNLKTGKQKTIKSSEGECIRPMGFIKNDFIYGYAKAEDLRQDANGQTLFPMYRIVIENSKGEVKKTYEPAGIYVYSWSIEENVLQMNRWTKSPDGYSYAAVASDQIIHNAGREKSGVILKSITTEKRRKEYQLDFGFSLSTRKKKCLRPKEVLLENVTSILLGQEQLKAERYYVYTKGKLENMYISAAEAIAYADETAGVVVNQSQEYVWERIRRRTQQQISGIEVLSTSSGSSSLEACMLSLLHYNENGTDPRPLFEQGMSALSVLQQELGISRVLNLTNVPLDKVLYCIDRGYPVLALTNTGNYVILDGYNELNTIVMDPVKGTNGYIGMNDSRAIFEGAGNQFIAVIPK